MKVIGLLKTAPVRCQLEKLDDRLLYHFAFNRKSAQGLGARTLTALGRFSTERVSFYPSNSGREGGNALQCRTQSSPEMRAPMPLPGWLNATVSSSIAKAGTSNEYPALEGTGPTGDWQAKLIQKTATRRLRTKSGMRSTSRGYPEHLGSLCSKAHQTNIRMLNMNPITRT